MLYTPPAKPLRTTTYLQTSPSLDEEILRAIKRSSDDPRLLYHFGRLLISRGEAERGETYLFRALDALGGCDEQGNALYDPRLAPFVIARGKKENEIMIRQARAEVLCLLGSIAAAAQKFGQAEEHYTKAILTTPDDAEALASFASYLIRVQELDRAERSYLRGLVINANHFGCLLGYAKLLSHLRGGDTELAAQYFERAVAQAEIESGIFQDGKFETSSTKKKRRRGPARLRGRRRLASALTAHARFVRTQFGDFDKAADILMRALNTLGSVTSKTNPPLVETLYELGVLNEDRAVAGMTSGLGKDRLHE